MKKSDLKLLQERNLRAVAPSAPKKEDVSDELTALFDDGTKLSPAAPPSPAQGSGGQTPSGGQTTPPPEKARQAHAPARDFNRRANSLERDALPAGLFPGASKKIYDALYLRSRGAVVPCRTVRATKRDLVEWSGVRNRKTIDAHLRYLAACGLIAREWQLGQIEGYLFEVRLPEEMGLVDRGGQTPRPLEGTDQKRDRGTDQILGSGGQSQTIDSNTTSDEPKTFIDKDQINDDEAFADFVSTLKQLTRDLTGKQPTKAEAVRWRELAEVISAEARIAAGRTSVSSVPAFLAEHLRRRLFKKDKAQLEAEIRSKPADKAAAEVDASNCPDCFGAGMYYPEGFEKGVAKCAHTRLTETAAENHPE